MRRLCTTYTLLFTLIASTLSAFAGAQEPPGKSLLSLGAGPQFRCQIGQRLTTSRDSLILTVAASVPYDHLVFLRADTNFAAQFELVTSIFRTGAGLIDERIQTVNVFTAAYATTNSRTQNAVRVDEFLLPPGAYNVRVSMIADKESRRKSKWEDSISLAPSDPLLRVSDLYWVMEDAKLAELGVPRIVETFSTREQDARARVQLFSAGTLPIHLSWTVKDETGAAVQQSSADITPDSAIQTHEFSVDISKLSTQKYELVLAAEGNGRREERKRPFGIRIPGIPQSITDLEEAIRQVKYLATTAENRELRQAAPPDREQLFKQFWERRDPTAGTEQNELMDEYYLRIEIANEKFATNRAGWESDRGRIFILYGEPTDIERHPFDAGARPYEIWYYSQIARRFVFVDYTGFGDYSLAGPEWGY
jgi:GWxTD domain-containing protein